MMKIPRPQKLQKTSIWQAQQLIHYRTNSLEKQIVQNVWLLGVVME